MTGRPAAILLATLTAGWALLLPVQWETHDGHYALYNLAQFSAALGDGQFPVRWLPDLFGGRGSPHFVYYHPLAFYLGALLRGLGLGTLVALRLLDLGALALSGWALARWLDAWLPRGAATLGGVAYLLAPIRIVEIHVKGDPPANLAYLFVPLVLLALRRCLHGRRGGVALLAAASAGLVLSHSVTALMSAPLLLAACFLGAGLPEPSGPLPAARALPGTGALRVAAGGALGALLSAFFWLPALAEKDFVRIDTADGILFFDFRDHFVRASQLLSPAWGYHGSFAGAGDDMAFQIGPVHALGLVAALALLAAGALRGTRRRLAIGALTGSVLALIGMLEISRPVWESLPPVRYLQFPWRLLAPVALLTALLLAVVAAAWDERADRRRWSRLPLLAALTPCGITAMYALATRRPWFAVLAAAYGAGGLGLWWLWRRRSGPGVGELLVGLLVTSGVPWGAVPLHAALLGAPPRIALAEADLTPERVRLGFRRTTARWDYLPRTVRAAPPLEPAQEFLPPPGARPDPDLTVTRGVADCGPVRRTSRVFEVSCDATSAARLRLNLHLFPGWSGRLEPAGETGAAAAGGRSSHAGAPLELGADDEGRIEAEIPAGRWRVALQVGATPVRALADRLSLAGFAGALLAAAMALARSRSPRRSASA